MASKNYRQCEPSSLRPPPQTDIFWTVYNKKKHSQRTRVFCKTWIKARHLGCIALMISLEECEAVPHERMH